MTSLVEGLARRSLSYATTVAAAHAQGSMNSLVLIERRGGYDVATREYDTGVVRTIYDTPGLPGSGAMAGVTITEGPSTLEIGDEPAYYDSLTVFLPLTIPLLPQIDDLLTILVTPDPDLVDRVFRVTGVTNGGRILASNRLSCSGVAPSKQWT